MDAREEEWGLPPTVPVRPRPVGRGLPAPPVLPLVAVICVFLGLGFGYRFAADPTPSATPSSSTVTAAPKLPTPAPVEPEQTLVSIAEPNTNPPADGLTISELLVLLNQPALWIPSSDVISASVARYNEVSATGSGSDQWVWVVITRSPVTSQVNGQECIERGNAATQISDCVVIHITQIIIVDYRTGEFLEARSWPL
jgi:hypothetical protein